MFAKFKKKMQSKKSTLTSKKNSNENLENLLDDQVEEDRDLIFPSLVDNMLNDGISFDQDHFKIQTGLGTVKYGRALFVKPSGYPRTVRINWLEALFSGDDLDCSVHIEPMERDVAKKKLQDKIDELESIIHSANKNKDWGKASDAQQKIEDTKFLQDEIQLNRNGLFFVSVQATVYADSLEELNEKCIDLSSLLGGESIEMLNAYGRQKDGFLSCLPLGKNFLAKSERNLDQLSLTAVFPHNSSKLNHTGGIPIGRYQNEYIFWNNFDRNLRNYSVGVFGTSGVGKSVFVKQLIGRGFMDGIKRNIIMDVEPEYIELTRALGGVVISIKSHPDSHETVSRINPLDIYPEREIKNKGKKNEFVKEQINLNEKIKEVIELVKVMKETVNRDTLGALEIGILHDVLKHMYEKRGITSDPESIYESVEEVDDSGKIAWGKRYIEMPTISELYRELKKKYDDKQYNELLDLLYVVELFTAGNAFGMFDGQTTIHSGVEGVTLDNAPVICFDISKLAENGAERPIAQHVLLTWVKSRFIAGDPKSKKRVVVDEAWMMLKYPTMVDFLAYLSARGRKWNVSLTLVSQRYEMFHTNEQARNIVSQFNTVCFLGQNDEDIDSIVDTFKFSPEVGDMIRNFEIGEVLVKTNREIVHLYSEPTPGEWEYLNTNQNIEVVS